MLCVLSKDAQLSAMLMGYVWVVNVYVMLIFKDLHAHNYHHLDLLAKLIYFYLHKITIVFLAAIELNLGIVSRVRGDVLDVMSKDVLYVLINHYLSMEDVLIELHIDYY